MIPLGIFLAIVVLIFAGLFLLMWFLVREEPPCLSLGEPERVTGGFSVISRPKIVDYLIDPDTRLSHIFVMPDALATGQITGYMPFTEEAQGISNIKLVRSGTGFRVYNHPTVKEGQWLPCR